MQMLYGIVLDKLCCRLCDYVIWKAREILMRSVSEIYVWGFSTFDAYEIMSSCRKTYKLTLLEAC